MCRIDKCQINNGGCAATATWCYVASPMARLARSRCTERAAAAKAAAFRQIGTDRQFRGRWRAVPQQCASTGVMPGFHPPQVCRGPRALCRGSGPRRPSLPLIRYRSVAFLRQRNAFGGPLPMERQQRAFRRSRLGARRERNAVFQWRACHLARNEQCHWARNATPSLPPPGQPHLCKANKRHRHKSRSQSGNRRNFHLFRTNNCRRWCRNLLCNSEVFQRLRTGDCRKLLSRNLVRSSPVFPRGNTCRRRKRCRSLLHNSSW